MLVLKTNHAEQKPFDGLFESLFHNVPATFGKSLSQRNTVQVNIYDSAEAYVLELNAPGRNKENFKLNLDKDLLTVSYESNQEKAEGRKALTREFDLNNFKRTFTIDENIAAENIGAKYENGLLIVTLPKKEEIKVSPKQINIQ